MEWRGDGAEEPFALTIIHQPDADAQLAHWCGARTEGEALAGPPPFTGRDAIGVVRKERGPPVRRQHLLGVERGDTGRLLGVALDPGEVHHGGAIDHIEVEARLPEAERGEACGFAGTKEGE